MNDIRNLMDNLHTHLEYREFDAGVRAPAEPWAVLDRIRRAVAPMAPAPAIGRDSVVTAIFPAAARMESASAPRPSRSLLDRYGAGGASDAAAPDGEASRRLPLAEVFAKLGRAGR